MALPSFSIVIPAYCAEQGLPRVLERIPEEIWDRVRSVWIVDDGSPDDTAGAIRRAARRWPRVRGVFLPANRGYGGAMKSGLSRVREEGAAGAVCLHADGQYAPEEMPRLLAALESRRLDLLQGSRHASGAALSGGMPLYKFVAGKALVAIENCAFGLRMTDYHSGCLCYGRRALEAVPFERLSESFDFDLEVIACCRAAGLAVGEEPIPAHYGDEISYLNPVTYGLRVLRVVGRYLTGRYSKFVFNAKAQRSQGAEKAKS